MALGSPRRFETNVEPRRRLGSAPLHATWPTGGTALVPCCACFGRTGPVGEVDSGVRMCLEVKPPAGSPSAQPFIARARGFAILKIAEDDAAVWRVRRPVVVRRSVPQRLDLAHQSPTPTGEAYKPGCMYQAGGRTRGGTRGTRSCPCDMGSPLMLLSRAYVSAMRRVARARARHICAAGR